MSELCVTNTIPTGESECVIMYNTRELQCDVYIEGNKLIVVENERINPSYAPRRTERIFDLNQVKSLLESL